MPYTIRFADVRPDMKGAWSGPAWEQAETLELVHFRREGSGHRPQTHVRLLYNGDGLFGIFLIKDRYVRCVHTRYLDPVYKDSCVEFFVQPKADRGYFNFEFNCGGALLCFYIVDPTRVPDGFRDFTPLPEADGRRVSIYHSLPQVVEPEIVEATEWLLEFFIPFALLETYVGPIGQVRTQEWRANFYKCADDTSHPHWASWVPLDELNFHLPRSFGTIRFERKGAREAAGRGQLTGRLLDRKEAGGIRSQHRKEGR